MNIVNFRASQAQWQRTLLPMQEMHGLIMGREDPLEKEMATHSWLVGYRP